jgi:hypothetical protein
MSVVIDTVTAADPASTSMAADTGTTAQPGPAQAAKPDMNEIREISRRDDERLRRLWAD